LTPRGVCLGCEALFLRAAAVPLLSPDQRGQEEVAQGGLWLRLEERNRLGQVVADTLGNLRCSPCRCCAQRGRRQCKASAEHSREGQRSSESTDANHKSSHVKWIRCYAIR
jgi:hypothetical protein